MSRGHIARAHRRSPAARRRIARYGRGQTGRRPNRLPPHLLPGTTNRGRVDNSVRIRLALAAAVVVVVVAVVAIVSTVTSAVAGVSGTMVAYREVNAELPNASQVIANTPQTTRIFDRDGTLLYEMADEDLGWRSFVPLDQISQVAIDATVAAEDATFWTHRGIEPSAIMRGLMINVTGTGSSGASTITQQLARSLYPDKISAQDISYTRKGREALAAVALEQKYSKADIMTMYLNQIFYGNRSYGIEAAAQTYFHKRASELNLAEASILAGLPQQPTGYNPSLYPDAAKARQKYVLDQMVKLRYVTRSEADAAYTEWPFVHEDRESGGQILDHPHFVNYVIEYIYEKYGADAPRFLQGGFDIYTTIDTDVQNRAEELIQTKVDSELVYYGAQNAALVAMVPNTGEILAMVGSKNFSDQSIEGQNNITTSAQQPGSAIKPIVYAAALEQGWNPGTVILDAPFREETPGAVDPITNEPMPFYEPQNYTRNFYGAVSMRTALSNSLNIPAIKAVEYAGGPEAIIEIARRMGIKHELNQPPEDYGLSIGLGSGDVWPLELTTAYATLANNGKYVAPNPILKIADSQGRVMSELDRDKALEQAPQVLRAEYAYQITSILTDSGSRRLIFGPGNLFETTQQRLNRPTAAKSGTTNDFRDIWTLGYTTDLTVGVWVGNTRNEQLEEIDGIQGAGPIWAQLMEEMHTRPEFAELLQGPNDQPVPTEFPRPPGIYEGVVCATTGQQPTENGNNRRELLVQGGAPALRCDQLSGWARGDAAKVQEIMRQGNSRSGGFVSGAVDSINRYLRMTRMSNSEFYRFPPDPPDLGESG